MTRPIYYGVVKAGDWYLQGVMHNCTPCWGKKNGASYTILRDEAEKWAKQHNGCVVEL